MYEQLLESLDISDVGLQTVLELKNSTDSILTDYKDQDWQSVLSKSVEHSMHEECLAPSQEAHPIARIFSPLLTEYQARINVSLDALSDNKNELLVDRDAIVSDLLKSLEHSLVWLASKAIVLELNCDRVRGFLTADSPAKRFDQFVESMCTPARYRSFLSEYKVLARRLSISVLHAARSADQLLGRLAQDWPEISEQLFDGEKGHVLRGIQTNLGDMHRQGDTVSALTFDGGKRLIYKPRSLTLDVRFSELLDFLNQHLPTDYQLRIPRTIFMNEYGWVDFIIHEECTCRDEIALFYRRQGALLALLYALEATDFHSENLVANGDAPVLLDLEALFHPRLPPESLDEEGTDDFLPGYEILENSVFRVGFLPQRVWAAGEHQGLDLSGLGSAEGQLSPHKVPTFEDDRLDTMHIVLKPIIIPAGDNRPMLKGSSVPLAEFSGDVIEGFQTMYRVLLAQRETLLARGGLIDAFSTCNSRVVIRATRIYGLLLGACIHPDVLRDSLSHERAFHLLWKRCSVRSQYRRLIPSEMRDLWNGDIPIFTALAGSRDLRDSYGTVISDFLQKSSLECVRDRIKLLDLVDMERQSTFIRSAIATLNIKHLENVGTPSESSAELSDLTQFLADCASQITDRLNTTAIATEKHVTWLGLQLVDESYWVFRPLGPDLYSGLTGVALYYAYYDLVFPSVRSRDTAYSLMRSCANNAKQGLSTTKRHAIGAFAGFAGVVYLMSHLASLWNDNLILEEAIEIASSLHAEIPNCIDCDLITGLAGWLLCLIALNRVRQSSAIRDMVVETAYRITELAIDHGNYLTWPHGPTNYKDLTGFSHGVSGIAFALRQAFLETGMNEFNEAASRAVAYETAVFSESKQNWPDFRKDIDGSIPEQPNFQSDWCHGAPGVGMCRALWGGTMSANITADLEIALNTTLRDGFGRNHSLCHGDFGNLELFHSYHSLKRTPVSKHLTETLQVRIADSIKRRGFLCGTPQHIENPGLMTGTAGIGYGLLRCLRPDLVPNVLALQPPDAPVHAREKVAKHTND